MGDINLQGRYLLVKRSVVRRIEGLPKSKKLRRVDMSPQLCKELEKVHQERETDALAKGRTYALTNMFSYRQWAFA